MNLLITARRIATTARDAVRCVIAPASLVADKAETSTVVTTVQAPEPAGLFTADEMPLVVDIERAALGYDLASDNARRADRAKRASRKILDRLPADGIYGTWRVFRTPSSRQTPDLAEITRIFKANGLGPVPMKPCAPSLKVELVEVAPAAAEFAALASV
jgi:hypothetical protein